MSAFIDTDVIVRHLTGDPPSMARRATAFLAEADELLFADLIVAETVYVLDSFYEVPSARVAELVRAVLAFPPMTVVGEPLLLQVIEVYEVDQLDFAEAYLVACAEVPGVGAVASCDKGVGGMTPIRHVVPGESPP